jgi:ankyrin repeat protein
LSFPSFSKPTEINVVSRPQSELDANKMDNDKQLPARSWAFEHLPDELLLPIVGHLDSVEDISAVTRLSRRFRLLFVDHLIDTHIKKSAEAGTEPAVRVHELFLHAANHDSTTIVEVLTDKHRSHLDVYGVMPPLAGLEGTTFLDFALAVDAPRVAAHLVRGGSSFDDDYPAGPQAAYPDQTPLCLALARVHSTSQWELDSALRIACSYALPRTALLLLTRGADPNSMSSYGSTAIHMAVSNRSMPPLLKKSQPYTGERLRWNKSRLELDPGVTLSNHERWVYLMGWEARIFDERDKREREEREGRPVGPVFPFIPGDVCLALDSGIASLLPDKRIFVPFTDEAALWEQKIVPTVEALLDFGADALALRTPSPRMHTCNHTCWRSLNCDHRGQTAVHLAAASGLSGVIGLLVTRTNSDTLAAAANADGYTPLYTAIAHGHLDTALFLLDFYNRKNEANPIVATSKIGTSNTTTALHAAARFAFTPLISALLSRPGVNPNTLSPLGLSPLHELLANTDPKREDDVVASIKALCNGDTRIEVHIRSSAQGAKNTLDTPQQMGQKHVLPAVREMFSEATAGRVRRQRVGKTAEEMREERLVREGKVGGHGWGDGFDTDLDGGAFPELGGKSEMLTVGRNSKKKGIWGKPPSVSGLGANKIGGGGAKASKVSGAKGQVGSWNKPLSIPKENKPGSLSRAFSKTSTAAPREQTGGGQGPDSSDKRPMPIGDSPVFPLFARPDTSNTDPGEQTDGSWEGGTWNKPLSTPKENSNNRRQKAFPSVPPANTSNAVSRGHGPGSWNKPLQVSGGNANVAQSQAFPSLSLTPARGVNGVSARSNGMSGHGTWATTAAGPWGTKSTTVEGRTGDGEKPKGGRKTGRDGKK